uniref:Uncharacterized protein n=1 Tax=Thermosporothrix sp. COM3 TaxID=2490863 RepID=A0A455SA32_9CHLR|nr:hypothetical protein KTC_00680 [Thermosporothrix sp. COM3]
MPYVLGAHFKYDDALSAYDETIRLTPPNAPLRNSKDLVLAKLQHFKEAQAAWKKKERLKSQGLKP